MFVHPNVTDVMFMMIDCLAVLGYDNPWLNAGILLLISHACILPLHTLLGYDNPWLNAGILLLI